MRALALAILVASGGCTAIFGAERSSPGDLGGLDASDDDGTTPDLPPGTVVWSTQTSTTQQNLNAIVGCSATNLFAAGANGTVAHSTMAGTWAPIVLGTNDFYAAAASTCASTYLVGQAGTEYYSSDGATFKKNPPSAKDLRAIWTNMTFAAAAGSGGVTISQALGANNWTSPASGTTSNLFAVFGSGTAFYAAGAGGTLLRSTNSGQMWTKGAVGTATLLGGWASGTDVYLVGAGGTILHSTDSGATFAPAPGPTSADLHAVWGSGPADVYVVGQAGTILHSIDGGVTWVPESGNTLVSLNGIWGSSANDVYAVGDSGTILHRP